MVDFIELEEKLIKHELTIRDTIKEKETLEKIDAILEKFDSRTLEKLSVEIKTAEHLSKNGNIKLPLSVKGVMLGVGRHKIKYYTEDELKKSVLKYAGKTFPIKLDHRNKEAGATIGCVDKIFWMPKERVIGFEGHINDETHARNILDGMHKDVSATIFSMEDFNESLGIVGLDLEFDELSIVYEGAFKGNGIYPA